MDPTRQSREHARAAVRLVADGVELGLVERAAQHHPARHESLPRRLSWKDEDRDEIRQISLLRGERRIIRAPAREFQIRTVLGDRYRLAEKQTMEEPAKAPPAERTCYVVMGFGKEDRLSNRPRSGSR